MTVAQRVAICYGQQVIPLAQFHGLCKAISDDVVHELIMFTTNDTIPRILPNTGIFLIVHHRMKYHQHGPQPISLVLRDFGHRKASVPIDKVFALIGMAKSYSGSLKRLVNYEGESQDNVMLDLANLLFDNEESLGVFDLAGIGWKQDHIPNLPSWAVDWTNVRFGMPLLSSHRDPPWRYHATNGMIARTSKGSLETETVVRGKFMDRIHSILPIRSSETTVGMTQLTMVISYGDRALDLARDYVQDPYASQSLEEAVWRTLIGDKTQTTRPAPERYGRVLRSSYQFYQEVASQSQSQAVDFDTLESFAQTLRERASPDRLEALSKDLLDSVKVTHLFDSEPTTQAHVFCTTESGYIGMVPQFSRVGDTICLIYGLDTPYVLRAVGGRFQLVGNSYVHGLMDGEGLDLPHDDEDFILF